MLLLCVQSLCMQYILRTIHCVYNTLFVSNAFCVQITFTCVTFKALTCGTLSIKTSSLTFLFLIHNKLFIFNVIFSFQLLLNRVAEVEGARERRSPKGQGLLRKEGPPTYAILSRNLVLSRFTRFLKGFHRAFN